MMVFHEVSRESHLKLQKELSFPTKHENLVDLPFKEGTQKCNWIFQQKTSRKNG